MSNLIDECVLDLKNGVGSRLADLSLLTHTLAQATERPEYYVMPQILGRFGNEVGLFHSLVDTPMLEQKSRETFRKILDTSVDEVVKSLKTIKQEICQKKTNIDCRSIIEALATVEKNAYLLFKNRTALVERVTSIPRPRGLQG